MTGGVLFKGESYLPDSSVETYQLPAVNTLANTDSLVALANLGASTSNTVLISLQNLLTNSVFDLTVQTGRAFVLAGPPVVPVNSNSNGIKGTISYSGNSTVGTLYVCVNTNTWGKVSLTVGGW